MNQTKAAFRLSIKREERPQSDLFDAAATPYAYHVVASNWPARRSRRMRCWAGTINEGQAEHVNKELKTGLGMEQLWCGDAGANAVFFRIGVLDTTSSWASNASPVRPRGRRRQSRRSGGSSFRWPGALSSKLDRWC
jgi:hypothetical protein